MSGYINLQTTEFKDSMESLKRDIQLFDWLMDKHKTQATIDGYIRLLDTINNDRGYCLTPLAKETYPIGFIKEYLCVSKI